MPAAAYLRKEYKGGVAGTTLAGSISDSDTSISITDATGWPDGSSNPFVVAIDRGGTEELILIASRSGTTLTVYTDGRGYDNTTAAAHSSGVTIDHVADAGAIDQANRLANLLTAVSQIIGFNGTNPTAVTGSTDQHVLQVDSGAATGLSFGRLITLLAQASAPSVTGIQRIWHDTTLDRHRISDGTSWLFDLDMFVFASVTARKAALTSPSQGQMCQIGGDIIEYFDGSLWYSVGVARFTNTTTRDAYYADATVALYDGALAKTTTDGKLFEYRVDEWILVNRKITISASAPSDPHDDDIWLQPS